MTFLDKTIRLFTAAAWFFIFGFLRHSSWWLLGLVPLITGYYGYCPIYEIIKRSKNGKQKK